MTTPTATGNPFAAEGEWVRGNTHTHTTNSDGLMPPESVAQHYVAGGYDFLFYTDHGKVTQPVEREDILLLPGTEVTAVCNSGRVCHVIGLNVRETFPAEARPTAQEVVNSFREQDGLAIMGHPYWSGLTLEELLPLEGLTAIEVYNATCETAVGKGFASVHWDDLLTRGQRMMAVAVDDCHRPAFDSHRAWTMAKVAVRTPAALMRALAGGEFYCSTGPVIFDLSWDADAQDSQAPGGIVRVRCSPAKSITLAADGSKGSRIEAGRFGATRRARRLRTGGQLLEGARDGDLLSGADFLLQGTERFVRVQIEDEHGRHAWTNPLFVRNSD